MKDFTVGIKDTLHTVPSSVQALSLLSELITRNYNGKPIEEHDVNQALRHLSDVLLNNHKNNLDTTTQVTKIQPYRSPLPHNISCSTDENNIQSDDDIQMVADSESSDSDDQSEPDMDYQKELLSRRMYYGECESEHVPSTPITKNRVRPASKSTPSASSTMIEDCSKSMLRNNRRHKDRSTPLASSTMMEDLLADIRADQPCQNKDESIVTWSINSTDTAELEEHYNRYFDIPEATSPDSDCELSTGFWVTPDADLSTIFMSWDSTANTSSDTSFDEFCIRNERLPRTSTASDLPGVNIKPEEQRKTSNTKQTKSRLLFFLQSVKKTITKRRSSKEKKRR